MDLHSEVYIESGVLPIQQPPRSRLFGLEPIAIGTAECEGLISYLVRLAKAHSVEARVMVRSEFGQYCGHLGGLRYGNFFSIYARTLHGTGNYAASFAKAAAVLTMRNDIGQLIMMPWQGVVPAIGHGLVGRYPKWCKACLREFREARRDAYFPLGWYLELSTACSRHGIRLSERCPWCSQRQPFFPYAPYLERCAHCNGWLGTERSTSQALPAESWELWLAVAIRDMIAHNLDAATHVTGEVFRSVLSGLVEMHAGGEKGAFSRAMGMTETTMSCWITKRQKPLFPQFLKLCHQLGMMPSEFFGMSSTVSPLKSIASLPNQLHRIQRKCYLRKSKKYRIGRELNQIVENADDCRSVAEVAQVLGVTRGYLNYWFRTLCLAISAKYKKHTISLAREKRAIHQNDVRIATFRIYCSGSYPSGRKVREAIRPLKLSLQRPELRAAHKKALKILRG